MGATQVVTGGPGLEPGSPLSLECSRPHPLPPSVLLPWSRASRPCPLAPGCETLRNLGSGSRLRAPIVPAQPSPVTAPGQESDIPTRPREAPSQWKDHSMASQRPTEARGSKTEVLKSCRGFLALGSPCSRTFQKPVTVGPRRAFPGPVHQDLAPPCVGLTSKTEEGCLVSTY